MEYVIDHETFLEIMKQDFEELADEHLIAESNENLWAKGSDNEEAEAMHKANAEMHAELYAMYKKLAKNPQWLLNNLDGGM
jgi:hypothetical protein